MAVNFLSESVEMLDRGRSRNISALNQNNTRGGRNSRGRGRTYTRQGNHNSGRNHGGYGRGSSRRGGNRGRNDGRHGQGGQGGQGGRSVGASTYIPPSEWNAMSYDQRQTFLQTRAASRIQAITSALNDDISALTSNSQAVGSNLQQVAGAQTNTSASAALSVITPGSNQAFGGRAAHSGLSG
jgi:hypothetical protein